LTATPSPSRLSLPKAIGWSVAFVVLTLLLAALLGVGAATMFTGSVPGGLAWLQQVTAGPMLLQAGLTIGCSLFFTWLIGMRVLRLTPADLRWTIPPGGAGFGYGILAGCLVAGIDLLLSVSAGSARWIPDAGTPPEYAGSALRTILVLAPSALGEELVFRGVPLVLLAAVTGRGTAVVAVAVGFALAHISNPNVTALGLGNIALAGVLLGLAFYAPGGLWTATGVHLGWNALLACLDTPVSGVPFRIPLLDYRPGGPVWLTGGGFGPEGGLAATLAMTLGIVVARRWAGKGAG
jgi:membrane protease YdiL (CAAX protease family)